MNRFGKRCTLAPISTYRPMPVMLVHPYPLGESTKRVRLPFLVQTPILALMLPVVRTSVRTGGDYFVAGRFFRETNVSARLILFLDHQNAYNGAREAFCSPSDPRWAGQIDPLRLGELIASRGLVTRGLKEVRVYRGRPDATLDPKSYGANLRQSEAQLRVGEGRVRVISRPLRYPLDWPKSRAQEKGVDVTLAIDFVQMAMLSEFDVGVIMSTDTDLRPALEAVLRLRPLGGPTCEVAAWTRTVGHRPRLSVPSAKIWCHWPDEADYLSVADRTDYNLAPL